MPINGYYFQDKLVVHSAPTLAHMKTANLFRINKEDFPNYEECLSYFNDKFMEFGLYITVLNQNDRSILIYVYQKNRLEHLLSNSQIRHFLSQYGYLSFNISDVLIHLKERLKDNEFPHEIGIFLGYPLYDVKGFIKDKNQYKIIGYWKVYGNIKNSRKIFDRYDRCIKAINNKISNGESLFEIIRKVNV